jgi:hypothetical protein
MSVPNVPSPQQLDSLFGEAHRSYLAALQRRWLDHRHPDVDATGRPVSRGLPPRETADGHARRTEIMRARVGHLADCVPHGRWDEHCYSPRSSQALLIRVVGALLEAGALGLLAELSGTPTPPITTSLEEIVGTTHFDMVLRDGGTVTATVEAKFVECGFNACSYPKDGRCSGTWRARSDRCGCPLAEAHAEDGIAYWNAVVEHWGLPEEPPDLPVTCPLDATYQAVHNLARTSELNPQAVWLLLYDERNPYFRGGDGHPGLVRLLRSLGTKRWAPISWQELIAASPDRVRNRLRDLEELHGLAPTP